MRLIAATTNKTTRGKVQTSTSGSSKEKGIGATVGVASQVKKRTSK
jgi:hypothetical protein